MMTMMITRLTSIGGRENDDDDDDDDDNDAH